MRLVSIQARPLRRWRILSSSRVPSCFLGSKNNSRVSLSPEGEFITRVQQEKAVASFSTFRASTLPSQGTEIFEISVCYDLSYSSAESELSLYNKSQSAEPGLAAGLW